VASTARRGGVDMNLCTVVYYLEEFPSSDGYVGVLYYEQPVQ
jgi:hypothetical protein